MNAPKLQRSSPLVLLVCSLCLGLADLARGQTPAAVPPAAAVAAATTRGASDDIPALRVAVSSVDESRDSPGPGTIDLRISVVGDLRPGAIVKKVTVTKAVDNLGNVLSSTTAVSAAAMRAMLQGGMIQSVSSFGRGGIGTFIGQTSLETSVRKAESLKYAEGTVEVFLPSEANGAIVRIPNVLSHAGRIEDPVLAKLGIEFYFLPDQASYDEARNQIAGIQTLPRAPDFPNGVGYFLRDPLGRLASHQLQEANGTVISPRGASMSRGNGTRTGAIHLQAPLPGDAQLVFFLAIPEATKTVPFRVEDILLP